MVVANIIVFRVSVVEAAVRMRVAISIVYIPVSVVSVMWSFRMPVAAVMMVMVCNYMVMVIVVWTVIAVVPVRWVVSPIVWRVPKVPVRIPEPAVYHWTVDVNRLYYVVASVDVFVTDYLNRDIFGFNIFFHIYRCNVLVDVGC